MAVSLLARQCISALDHSFLAKPVATAGIRARLHEDEDKDEDEDKVEDDSCTRTRTRTRTASVAFLLHESSVCRAPGAG